MGEGGTYGGQALEALAPVVTARRKWNAHKLSLGRIDGINAYNTSLKPINFFFKAVLIQHTLGGGLTA